jgi:hypothetical protein
LSVDAEQDAPLSIQAEALEHVHGLPNGLVHRRRTQLLRSFDRKPLEASTKGFYAPCP